MNTSTSEVAHLPRIGRHRVRPSVMAALIAALGEFNPVSSAADFTGCRRRREALARPLPQYPSSPCNLLFISTLNDEVEIVGSEVTEQVQTAKSKLSRDVDNERILPTTSVISSHIHISMNLPNVRMMKGGLCHISAILSPRQAICRMMKC